MKRTGWFRYAALASVSALVLAACGSGDGDNGDGSSSGDKVTLKVSYWGNFGLKELEPVYEAANPNIDIVLDEGEYNAQHENLQKFLVAGSGAPDVAAIDEGFTEQFRAQGDKFVNLLDLGAGDYQDKYLEWKWNQVLTPDGAVIGLGTDVGGMAMCYRRDLFEAAGLPTEREAVSALWPTWDDFIATGEKYVAGSGGRKFVDAGTNIYNPVLAQQPVGAFNTDDTLAMDGGPKVAWDVATKAIDAGISANLATFQPEWNAAFKNGEFAVLTCPAWMMGYIQGQAPNTSGKWDVAAMPGGGGGNWGGSFYTIPAQGKHQQEAYDFIEWVIQPEQQITIFKNVGNLPSQPALYEDPAIKDFKNPFFNNAPVGQIFSAAAANLTPQFLGSKNGPVRVAVENVLRKVEAGDTDATKGWDEAVSEAEKAAR